MKLNLISRSLIILAACVSLSACMTPQQRYHQDFDVAKKNFAIQNYRTAFNKLQTPAKNGVADAQYALGYLYYYGKGTVANRRIAGYWFQKAANQGQPAAKKAITMMQSTN